MRRFIEALTTALLVAHSDATQHSHVKRIVGGKDAVKGRYPAYGIPTGNELLCGATLIAPDVMISAAHCKGAFTAGSSSVAIGGTKLNWADAPEILGVDYEVIHPRYDPETVANDVMLVKLDAPSTVAPVVLNNQPDRPQDGAKIVIIGFGTTEFKGDVSPILQEVESNVVSSETCVSAYEKVNINVNSDKMLCTGVYGGGKGSCQGDSGGPIFSRGVDGSLVLIATISWGKGCASAVYPGVSTRVSAYMDFIEKATCQISDYAPSFCQSGDESGWKTNASAAGNVFGVTEERPVSFDAAKLTAGNFAGFETESASKLSSSTSELDKVSASGSHYGMPASVIAAILLVVVAIDF